MTDPMMLATQDVWKTIEHYKDRIAELERERNWAYEQMAGLVKSEDKLRAAIRDFLAVHDEHGQGSYGDAEDRLWEVLDD